MGGGGEGLMAVIQSLPAGLAVVLLDRKRQELDRRREELDFRRRFARRDLKDLRSSRAFDPPANSLTPPCRSAGVETDPTLKINTSSQICDGQYASTYQLAHCSLTPTSPLVDLPEFPPQRPAPCRNQGNFEVGGFGSGECYRSRSPSPPTHGFRGGMQWPDRGSVYSPRPQLERDDAFANSLRKYPNAPEGTPSAELVQRLIRNTQAKFLTKTRHHHSKSLRNLGDKSPTHSKTNLKKSSKNLQTYTRKRNEEREQAVINYEIRRNNTRQRGFKTSGMLRSPGCSKEIRARDTFDYLSCNIPRPAPGTASGDRYVKDSIRDSLRTVYGDGRGPVATYNLCPRIQSRYERHRREHHAAGSSKQGSMHEALGLKVHSSETTLCEPKCCKPSTSKSNEKVDVSCECNKPEIDNDIDKCTRCQNNTEIDIVQCVCPPDKMEIDESVQMKPVDNCKFPSEKVKINKCSCRSKKRKLGSISDVIDEGQELEDIISAWLEELPVSSNEKPNDKTKRAVQTKKLCETLSSIKDDKFDAKGKEEIKKCIDKMPIWLPHDKEECDNFKDKIADALFEKLKDFRHRNTFTDVIEEWLEGIDFEEEKEICRKTLALDLSNELKKMDRKRSSNERLYLKKLKCKILDWLEDLPIQTIGDRIDALEKLADELIDKLLNYKGAKISEGNAEKEPYINAIISALNDFPELTELSVDEKQRIAKNLLDKLPNTLLERNENDNTEQIRGIIRFFIIRNWLMQLAKDNKVEIDKTTEQDFIKDLILKLADAHESRNKNKVEMIMDFLRELPTPPDSNNPEVKKMVEEFSNAIEETKPGTRRPSDVNKQLLTTTENWLKKCFENSGTEVDPKTLPIHAKTLASKLSKSKRKISFTSPMLTEILHLTPKSKTLLVDDSSNRTNTDDMSSLECKFNDILENLVLRRKDETLAGELMSLLQELELANASGNISSDIYNRLMSRVHELSASSNNEDIFDFMRDDTGRKVATSTPRKQGRGKDGSTDEEEQMRKVATSTPRKRGRSRDGSLDEEENIQLNKSKDVRRPTYNRDQSKGGRQFSPNSDQRRSSQSRNLSRDESQLGQSRDKSEDQKQQGTSTVKSQDESNFYKDIHDTIHDWVNQLKLNLKDKDKDLVTDIANDLEDRRKYLQVNPNARTSDDEELEHMKYQIFKRFNKLVDTPTINTIMPKVRTLMDNLKGKLAKLANSTDSHLSGTSPMTQMDDAVRNWCNDLPLPDNAEGDAKKQDIHDKVMVKIGELNMNPKILNDDTLYEDMLFDNIDEQLSGLPINSTDNIKAALMGNLNPIREKLKENWAGQAYKQQLRDNITKASPSLSNLTEDEQASFEIMKDNLADAYINLHYVADDENLKTKFKDKINKEIDRFCGDYLKRHPDKPLNATQLNKDLYSALKKVDVPRDESMRSEVELCRMKDIIDDWAEELNLDEKTATEKLQRNKNSTLLAQRLHELEKENELTPDDQYEQKVGHEIEKYLKKLPLQNKKNLRSEIDRLRDMVKNTEHSRTFTSGSRRSIDDGISGTQGSRRSMGEGRSGPQTRTQSTDCDQEGGGPQGSRLSVDKGRYDYFQNCPVSCLSRDDQAHLQRIRERIIRQEETERKTCCLDSTSLVKQSSIDHGSQVNMEPRQHQQVQCRCSKPGTKSPVIQSPCSSRSQMPMTECRRQPGQVSTGSQIEISPYVVVKEYFWDNPPMPEGARPPSPPTPLPALSSCSILPQNKPLPHRQSRNRPQVTIPRSFHDDDFVSEACRRPMTPRHCGRPFKEDISWECPKDEHDHGTPRRMWSRPHIYRDNGGISPCYSSERKESSVRCECGGKISKCRIRNPVVCQLCHDDPMKYCPRCCGTLCPHPTDFYFR